MSRKQKIKKDYNMQGGISEIRISNECSIEECTELNEEAIKEVIEARSKQQTISNNHTVTFIMNGKGKEK